MNRVCFRVVAVVGERCVLLGWDTSLMVVNEPHGDRAANEKQASKQASIHLWESHARRITGQPTLWIMEKRNDSSVVFWQAFSFPEASLGTTLVVPYRWTHPCQPASQPTDGSMNE